MKNGTFHALLVVIALLLTLTNVLIQKTPPIAPAVIDTVKLDTSLINHSEIIRGND